MENTTLDFFLNDNIGCFWINSYYF